MLDHRLFASQPGEVLARLRRRGVEAALIDKLSVLVGARSQAIQKLDALRHALKTASDAVSEKARAGDQAAVAVAREQLKALKGDIKAAEEAEGVAQSSLDAELLLVANLPDPSVPDGKDSADNRVERVVGEARTLPFTSAAHWELGEKLGILDFERAGKISGARFAILRGQGARLERALINFMLDMQREHGYVEVWPPLLVRPAAMQGVGQYPKFIGESFETLDRELVLIPTAEVALVAMHADEILDEAALPLRYTAYTPCFRREAGAAGKDTRGLIRQHQFNKVELVSFCTPEESGREHERLTGHAEAVLQRLGLPYRVVALCAGDLGFAAAKTYDLEVWMPGQGAYREISSCSNCGDFQARRAKIRYRPKEGGDKAKPRLVHTLNGSGLAVGRTLVAILENGQQADGSIRIPPALASYFGSDLIAAR